jgi:non-ribosomal peptide synthase protein (TIGR01720 family)
MRLSGEGEEEEERLLLCVHHLAVDGVSWRVLLEDLQRGYEQGRRGLAVEFGEKTTSFKAWAERLTAYASSPEVEGQRAYWQGKAEAEAAPMPVDFEGGENLVGSVETVGLCLAEGLTRRLLHEAGRAYNTRITELLLAALARAWRRWSGQSRVRVELEGHGREQEEVGGADVTRTVGWFTTIYPVTVAGTGEVGECVKWAKEELRGVPAGGLGYGVLRYLGEGEGAGWPEPEVIFNYLGQFDQVLGEDGGFSPAEEDAGEMWSPRMKRRHLLEVSGSVVDGRLQMGWSYGRGVHRRESIEALASEYERALEEIVEHCTQEDAGGYTPSDFPDVFLNQEQLNTILEKVG